MSNRYKLSLNFWLSKPYQTLSDTL